MLDKKKEFLCSEIGCKEQNDFELPFGDIKEKYLPIYRMNLFGDGGIYQITSHIMYYLLKMFKFLFRPL